MGRRNNPDYDQISVLINAEVAKQLRLFCTGNKMLLADAVEQAVVDFLNKNNAIAR